MVKVVGNYQIKQKDSIGKGSYGYVCKAIHILSKHQAACKVLKKANLELTLDREKIEKYHTRETTILKQIDHKNIVRLYSIAESKNNMQLSFIDTQQCNIAVGDPQRLKYIMISQSKKSFASWLPLSLHQSILINLIHRDIKPDNIMINNGQIKLLDFGLARIIQGENIDLAHRMTYSGTPMYCNPQVFEKKQYSGKCDVWSLGVIFYEMIYKKLPFNGRVNFNDKDCYNLFMNIKKRTFKTKIKLPQNPFIGGQIKEVLQSMLQYQEKDRVSLKQLAKNKIFANQIHQEKIIQIKQQQKQQVLPSGKPTEEYELLMAKLKKQQQKLQQILRFVQTIINKIFVKFDQLFRILIKNKILHQKMLLYLYSFQYLGSCKIIQFLDNLRLTPQKYLIQPFKQLTIQSYKTLQKQGTYVRYIKSFQKMLVGFNRIKNQTEMHFLKHRDSLQQSQTFKGLIEIIENEQIFNKKKVQKYRIFLVQDTMRKVGNFIGQNQSKLIYKYLYYLHLIAVFQSKYPITQHEKNLHLLQIQIPDQTAQKQLKTIYNV